MQSKYVILAEDDIGRSSQLALLSSEDDCLLPFLRHELLRFHRSGLSQANHTFGYIKQLDVPTLSDRLWPDSSIDLSLCQAWKVHICFDGALQRDRASKLLSTADAAVRPQAVAFLLIIRLSALVVLTESLQS